MKPIGKVDLGVLEIINFKTMGLDISINRINRKEIGYFRKVNFLVAFFEKKGMDVNNQIPILFDKETAEELLNLCNQVLKDHSKAEELLPTMDGFFFGNTEYDKYYFNDVRVVKRWIENTLLPEFNNLDNDQIEFSIWY